MAIIVSNKKGKVMKKIILPLEVINTLVDYLVTKPFREVSGLLGLIQEKAMSFEDKENENKEKTE